MRALSPTLLRVIGGRLGAPVIVEAPNRLSDLSQLVNSFGLASKKLPLFDMLSFWSPLGILRDKLVDLDYITNIAYDAPIFVPELIDGPGPFFIDRLQGVGNFRILSGLLTRIDVANNAQPGWIPTHESIQYVGAREAHDMGLTGNEVKVAVIDSDSSNRYALQRQLEGVDITVKNTTYEPTDLCGHGGHCTTILAGRQITAPNGLICHGVAPGIQVMGVKALRGAMGSGQTSNILTALSYAYDWGAKIINLSLGSNDWQGENDPLSNAISRLTQQGVMVVAAAGNNGPDGGTLSNPGISEDSITVGSYSILDSDVAALSSRGPTPDGRMKPDILGTGGGRADWDSLPDELIYSGITQGTFCDRVQDKLSQGFAPLKGTSMATPQVAGVLALATELFRQHNIELSTPVVKDVFNRYGLSKNNDSGHGLVNFKWFIDYIL